MLPGYMLNMAKIMFREWNYAAEGSLKPIQHGASRNFDPMCLKILKFKMAVARAPPQIANSCISAHRRGRNKILTPKYMF